MKKKLSVLVFLVALGLFLAPAMASACGKAHKKGENSSSKQEASSGKHETTSKTEKTDCCKGKHKGPHKSKTAQGCGNCNHSNCSCAHFSVTVALPADPTVKNQNFNSSDQKQSVFDTEDNLSSGFHSIWHPPKIS